MFTYFVLTVDAIKNESECLQLNHANKEGTVCVCSSKEKRRALVDSDLLYTLVQSLYVIVKEKRVEETNYIDQFTNDE